MKDLFSAAAYGGEGWSPRRTSTREELGSIWRGYAIDSEYAPLRAVLLHRPGPELDEVADPDEAQMVDDVDVQRARRQHDAIADAFRASGVEVHYVRPSHSPPPNLMFVADLMVMTPEGAVLGRPASTVRAGEERWVAGRLSALGIPILRSVRGRGTFEGADAAWLDLKTAMVATGLRTNREGAAQVRSILEEMDVTVVDVELPYGAMHLMGQLRFADRDLAVAWPGRVPFGAVETLRARGYDVIFLPDENEARKGMALNFVTLGPRHVLMPAGNPVTQARFEAAGIACETVQIDELVKAAGGIGCLTGILARDSVG